MIAKLTSFNFVLSLILATAIIFLLTSQGFKKSSLLLDSKENKFTVNFDLKKEDPKNLIEILDKINFPQSIVNGVSFELDSTSSANLAYLTPIKSDLDIKNKSIAFSGKTSHSLFASNNQLETFKVPESSNLVVYSENLIDFVTARSAFTEKLENWLKDNFPKEFSGYLIVFGKQADYAIITKDRNIDFSSLSNVPDQDQLEDSYKIETQNEISYHLLNIVSTENGQRQTLTLFKIDNWQVLASSRDAAFAITGSIQSKEKSINFPLDNIDRSSDFVVFYQNSDEFPPSQNLINLFWNPRIPQPVEDETSSLTRPVKSDLADDKTSSEPDIISPDSAQSQRMSFFEANDSSRISPESIREGLQKVKSLNFALKANEFSGLIEFK